jgi:tRNA-uridine 2-sulfurtransferase
MSSAPSLVIPDNARVLLAISGGVDSSIAGALLRDQLPSDNLAAAYIRTWQHEERPIGDCPWRQDASDAQAVCQKLDIPFDIVNLISDYEREVARLLIEGYRRGITPNPDIACNRAIKFGAFLALAQGRGFTHLATGHYARCHRLPTGDFALLEGLDSNKDQSYFLAQLSQAQLAAACFPLGEMTKPQVRQLARQYQLPNAAKKDSQGICFLGRVKIGDFLSHYIPDSPGHILNHEGRQVGTHQGLHRYTLGQRHGFGVPSNRDGEHYVVVAKDFARNTLQVAFDHPTTPGLYTQELKVHHLHWVRPSARAELGEGTLHFDSRPRYRDPRIPSLLTLTSPSEGILHFQSPQRALASGQVVAFYLGAELVASAVYI